jgi:two-component system sensor histidine kinase MprB
VSLRRRLALLVAVAVAAAVAIVSGLAYMTARASLRAQFDETLRTQARQLATAPTIITPSGPVLIGPLQVSFRGVNADGTTTASRVSVPVDADELAVAREERKDSIRTVRVGREDIRIATVNRPAGGAIQVFRSLSELDATLRRLRGILLIASLAGIAAAAYAGLVVARTGLAPVDRLTEAAEHVAKTQDLSASIAVSGTDEIARLGRSFNSMLAALDASQQRQRQLVADAGHELRTPLTSLRTNIELLARSDADPTRSLPPEHRSALVRDLTEQLEELTALVADVTQLARGDEAPDEPVWLDLSEVVVRAVRRTRRRAPGVRFVEALEPTHLLGRPAVLERAVTNLLDNAAKWSPPGGQVSVTLSGGTLVVRDQGPGIAAEDAPYVFDRFYRSAAARGTPGSGLGLAIAHDAVAAHGGSVSVETDGGAVVTVRLPHPYPQPQV